MTGAVPEDAPAPGSEKSPGRPGELVRVVADPDAQRRAFLLTGAALAGFAVLAVVSMVAIATGTTTLRFLGIALLVVAGVPGVCGTGARLIRLLRARRTGDDAIDLVVTEDGLVGPGGLPIPWSEVAGIEMSGTARGQGPGGDSSALRIMLTDAHATLGRTTTPRQAAAIRTDGVAHVLVELTNHEVGELDRVRAVLDAELAPRGQQVREIGG